MTTVSREELRAFCYILLISSHEGHSTSKRSSGSQQQQHTQRTKKMISSMKPCYEHGIREVGMKGGADV